MEKLFELTFEKTSKNSCSLRTAVSDEKGELIPLLIMTIVEGIRARDFSVCRTLEIMKSVVESVDMNIDMKYNTTEKTFNGKDRS